MHAPCHTALQDSSSQTQAPKSSGGLQRLQRKYGLGSCQEEGPTALRSFSSTQLLGPLVRLRRTNPTEHPHTPQAVQAFVAFEAFG